MSNKEQHAAYLGDGAYASIGRDNAEVIITTGCHYGGGVPDNTVYLGPREWQSLLAFFVRNFPRFNWQRLADEAREWDAQRDERPSAVKSDN
jgi:hypothetical protein